GYGGCSEGITNVVVQYNFVDNYCYADSDCGALECQDFDSPRSVNVNYSYNYIRNGDVGEGGANYSGRGFYHDDGCSNVTMLGNVVSGIQAMPGDIHGGNDNVTKFNIFDLGPNGNAYNFTYQGSPTCTTTVDTGHGIETCMAGNSFMSNIIIAKSTGPGPG